MESIQSYFQPQSKQQILHPMNCMVRLALLQYKSDSTKISVIDNSIYYNQPGLLQGIIRYVNGDKREDIHNIYQPILKAIEWYDISNEVHLYIFQECLKGLDKLIETYSTHSTIHTTIQHYRKLLNSKIQGETIDEEIDKSKESPLINELQNFWDIEEIQIIFQLLKLLKKQMDPIYLQNIEDILQMKEKKLKDYIQQSSTSYS
jgi:hypothetical protein